MKQSFRQSMTWLHTWTGLVVGWVLFFVFVTGTASYATQEITRWMQPERPMQPLVVPDAATQFEMAYQQLLMTPQSHQAQNWTVNLASDARNSSALSASWTAAPEPGERRGRTETLYIDTSTGQPVELAEPVRETAGGRALLRMHYALHYIPADTAILIVGLCTMFMLVAIVTGVVAHKKIIQDFFTYRQQKGLRSWLDAHNLISVSALPFYLMITYSGLLFFLYSYMPLAVPLTYGFDPEHRDTYYSELMTQTGSGRVLGMGGGGGGPRQAGQAQGGRDSGAVQGRAGEGRGGREAESERAEHQRERVITATSGREEQAGHQGLGDAGGQQGEPRRQARQPSLAQQAEHFTDLKALVAQTEADWGEGQIRSVSVTAAARGQAAQLQIAPAYSNTIRRNRGAGTVSFDAVTGQPLQAQSNELAAPELFGSSMLGLHEGLYAGSWLRWLYLLSGLLGCAMIATGLVLWTVKRRPKLAKTGEYETGHQLVERLNVATIAGLSFGLAAYFWANRLIPADLAGRQQWEIHTMFLAWGALALYSFSRPVFMAWRDSLSLAAAAFLLLPLLNALTTERHLGLTLWQRDWALASVDLVFILLGLMLGWAALKVQRKLRQAKPNLATARRTSAVPQQEAH